MQRIREGLNMNIFQKIREYFPCVKERIFLNHAGVSPLCIPVSEAIQGYLKNKVSGEEEDFDVDSARKLFAQLINASSEEVALVPNTSTGLSIAANLLKYPRSSNVVTTDLEFPSVVYPWLRIKMISNLEIRYVKNIKGRLRLEDFEKAVNDDTVAVVISHVEYGNGFKNGFSSWNISSTCRFIRPCIRFAAHTSSQCINHLFCASIDSNRLPFRPVS